MLKKVFCILIMMLLLLGLCGNALAKDTYTATTTINGVTVNWQYELNDSNQIENLKCTNHADLKGSLTIPSTLDGKTVVELKSEAFKGATNITSLTIPSTIKTIGYSAFEGCSNLSNVNLGQVEKLSFDVFKNCPKLTTITIPKTLTDGPGIANNGVFTGTTNLTSVTFESGSTTIASGILKNCAGITKVTIPSTVTKIGCHAFENSGLTEIMLPNTIKTIEYSAFEGCSSLSNVNLGQVERLSFDVFKNCPKLTTITIPKTLTDGPGIANNGVFTGTTNLTSVTFESGSTTIASGILKDCTSITSVTIPSTVTKIGCRAFENSGITEITFSNSLQEIEYYTFNNCFDLTKITILDNCTKIGWFTLYPTQDTVFQNHNDILTIYCYEGSKIEEYAIATNIKYVYLTKTTDETTNDNSKKNEEIKSNNSNTTNNSNNTNITNNSNNTNTGISNNNGTDNTTAKLPLPQTGEKTSIFIVIAIVLVGGVFLYFKFYKFKDI